MGLYTNIKRISSDDILDALRSNLSESVSSSGTIESLNEEFEVWLDCLIDEGYDLSEYTLDEMHEIYENYDNHNLVIEYLIAENFADDSVSANTMIEYMSEEWLDNILESKKWIQKAIKKKRSPE